MCLVKMCATRSENRDHLFMTLGSQSIFYPFRSMKVQFWKLLTFKKFCYCFYIFLQTFGKKFSVVIKCLNLQALYIYQNTQENYKAGNISL